MSFDLIAARDILEKGNRAEVNLLTVAGQLPAALAEVERLHAKIAEIEKYIETDGDCYEAWSRLGQNEGLREALRDLDRARDEACDIAYRMARNNAADMELTDRIDELRNIGKAWL